MDADNTLTLGTVSEPAHVATPENTPRPGGGSWHWDDVAKGWAENPPYGSTPAPVANDPATPSQEKTE